MASSVRWWLRFVKVVQPLFAPAVRMRSWTWLAVILALALSLNGLNLVNSYVGRGFMTALADRKSSAFYVYFRDYLIVFACSTVIAVFYQFVQDRLALFWRQWLTGHFVRDYLTDHTYYRLHARAEIDNPDQRLSEDVRSFTTTLVAFLLLIVNSSLTVAAFAVVLWSIQPWLFAAAVVYTVGGSVITFLLGHRLVHLNFLQLAKEANLRYGLIRIREYAEPIALLHGEPEESAQVGNRLADVVETVKRIIAVRRNMGFFTSLFNYLVPILPVVIVAPAYLRGEIEFGQVTQAAMAFAQFLGGLAVFIEQFQNISVFAAVVTRLSTLQETIPAARTTAYGEILVREDANRVAYDKLTLRTPDEGRVLIANLSLEIPPGRRLLIQGSDGAGKSALFRATAGLWDAGSGAIACPPPDQLMFLPQKPYTVFGTFRDQLLYGLHDRGISDQQLQTTLRVLKLDPVVQRVGGLNVERDWPSTLSLGEQQLVAFARLLLFNPRFAFLDQAVSSLGARRGAELYQLLSDTSITYLSTGDHSHIQKYHDVMLEISDDGSWKVRSARQVQPA